jgi:hypothetical protein
MLISCFVLRGAEEADHTFRVESVSLAAQGALIGFRLVGALAGRIAEKDHRA